MSLAVLLFAGAAGCGEPATGDLGDLEPEVCPEADEVVQLATPGGTLRIDRFEASRRDATAVGAGRAVGVACSRGGVLPWTEVSLAEAEAACAAAGARLCTRAELLQACTGGEEHHFPYGSMRVAGRCNDYHQGAGVRPTGSSPACTTPEGVLDLVGNVAEWARPEQAGDPALAAGGSAKLTALAVSLRLDRCAASEDLPPEMRREDIGFRCCGRPVR